MNMAGVYFYWLFRVGPHWLKSTIQCSTDICPPWEVHLPIYEPCTTLTSCIFFSKSKDPKVERSRFDVQGSPPSPNLVSFPIPLDPLVNRLNALALMYKGSPPSPNLKALALMYKSPLRPPIWYTLDMEEHSDRVLTLHREVLDQE
eukprot:gene6446-3075_t